MFRMQRETVRLHSYGNKNCDVSCQCLTLAMLYCMMISGTDVTHVGLQYSCITPPAVLPGVLYCLVHVLPSAATAQLLPALLSVLLPGHCCCCGCDVM